MIPDQKAALNPRASSPKQAVVIALLVIMSSSASGQSLVPAVHQAAIFARVLAYDRALKARAGTDVRVGILFKPTDASSMASRDAMLTAFRDLQARTIQGLPLKVVDHPYRGNEELAAWMSSAGIETLYVTSGFDVELRTLQSLFMQARVVSISPVRKYVEGGLCVGIILKDNKPALLVNLSAARGLGMDLDPKVLQLAEVIR